MNNKVIEKINNLLKINKENGANENEVQNAMLLAQKLMYKHDITESDLEVEETEGNDIIESFIDEKFNRYGTKSIRALLLIAIAQNFRCEVVEKYKLNKKKKVAKALTFVGKRADAEMATMLFNASFYIMESKAQSIYKKTGERDKYTSYCHGFIYGLKKKFDDQKKEYGLVVVKPQKELDEFFEDQNIETEAIKPKQTTDTESYCNGYKAGNSFNENVKNKLKGDE